MSLSRRDVLRTAALGASGAVLTGCGGGESGSSLSGGETAGSRGTIAVSYPAESTGTFRGLLERFTAETDIGVRWLIQQGDYKRFQQQMTVQFGSRDSSFDVVFCDDYCTTQFAAAGFLSELEPVADAQGIDIDDWPKATIEDTSRWRGKLYRLPANCEIFLFVYRTDAFAKAGVEPPATWDQLIDVGRKIMESGASEYGIGLQGRANGVLSNDIQAWGGQAGASILDLDTPESKESLAFYKGLFTTEKVAQPGAPQEDYGITTQGFLEGRYAMWWTWDGVYSAILRDKTFDQSLADVTVPPRGPDNGRTLVASWGWVINAYSERQELAAEFLRFITSLESMSAMTTPGRVPGRVSGWDDPAAVEAVPQVRHFRPLLEEGLLAARPVTPSSPVITDVAEQNIGAYLTDQKSLDVAVDDAMTKIGPLVAADRRI